MDGLNKTGRSLDALYTNAPGMVGEIAGYINRTASQKQPAFALANALAFWGTVVGRKVETKEYARTNIYAIGVGESCCGKDHSRKAIKRICKAAGLTMELLGGEDVTSDAAILRALSERPSLLFQIDEVGHFFGGLTARNATSAHRTIAPTLTKLFSSSATTYIGKEYADSRMNERRDIDQPNACLYGTTVPCRLVEAISVDQITDGFLPRILMFVTDNNNPQYERDANTRESAPERIVKVVTAWWQYDGMPKGEGNIGEITEREPVVVPFAGDAKAQFDSFREHCSERRRELQGQTGRDVLWGRAHEHALKVALTVSASDPEGPLVIEPEAAEWAIELVWHLIGRFDQLIQDNVSENATEATSKRVLGIIRKAGPGGLRHREVTRKTQQLTARDRASALTSLEEGGYIKIVSHNPARGPKSNVYVAAQ